MRQGFHPLNVVFKSRNSQSLIPFCRSTTLSSSLLQAAGRGIEGSVRQVTACRRCYKRRASVPAGRGIEGQSVKSLRVAAATSGGPWDRGSHLCLPKCQLPGAHSRHTMVELTHSSPNLTYAYLNVSSPELTHATAWWSSLTVRRISPMPT